MWLLRKALFLKCKHVRQYSTRIDKVLIANRGEIACRIMKTARKLGISSVAVFSDADANSLHVNMADEAYHIGPAPSQSSYLCSEKLVEVALRSQCQAVHPGYGFLSENAEFAERCQEARIAFIGPPASAIRDMGIKSTSKAIMIAAGVPTIKGYHGNDQSDERLRQEADKIGFPVMIKAVRGGGGKGMRICHSAAEFQQQLDSARNESLKAFNDTAMLLETYVGQPRHVEVQVFGDSHGNYVYLHERDCSVQRRHQKVIEEAPGPGITPELRSELGAAATRAARAVGYLGAGTVEFILDKNTLEYFFMEMNTRLQVEHPVTEMITGLDLVEWQFKVANGEPLPLSQTAIPLRGHAFEGRVYAEDPANSFLPAPGRLQHLSTPPEGEGCRVEAGVRSGDEISVFYDPMIAKLVVWGRSREEALARFKEGLLHFHVAGVPTNINFLLSLSKHPEFSAGNVHTNFIPEHSQQLFKSRDKESLSHSLVLAIITQLQNEIREYGSTSDPFITEGHFRVNYNSQRTFKYDLEQTKDKETTGSADVTFITKDLLKIVTKISATGDTDVVSELMVEKNGKYCEGSKRFEIECRVNDKVIKGKSFIANQKITLFTEEGTLSLSIPEAKYLSETREAEGSNLKAVSPMPGIVDKIFVKKNDLVKIGDPLVTIIAMKMEYLIKAPRDGKIEEILHKIGDSVAKNAALVKYEE